MGGSDGGEFVDVSGRLQGILKSEEQDHKFNCVASYAPSVATDDITDLREQSLTETAGVGEKTCTHTTQHAHSVTETEET